MSPAWALALAVALLAANAYFVGAEFAVISVRRSTMQPLADSGSRRAQVVLDAQERLSDLLTCAQLGITVCSTSLGALAEPAIARLIDSPLETFGLGQAGSHALAGVIALVLVVYLHVVIGEMVPKNLAIAGPERAALLLTPTLLRLTRLAGPLIKVLTVVANWLVRLVGVDPCPEVQDTFTAAEVASIVERSQAEGTLDDRSCVLTGVLEFAGLTVGQAALARDQLVCVPQGVSAAEFERTVAQSGFSRYPVVGAAAELVGYLHVMDVLGVADDQRNRPLPNVLIRPLPVVGASDSIDHALSVMRSTRSHLLRVDQDSALFLEDIIETLVGEVHGS
ncbi:MAG: hemolysin family protein [Bifidobacteriaceae bacterium]|jgi:CBS domain containing-hemolysin-like protein|nr:hemolysin family protein [Bifidobacteriaceae bacterium]